MPGRLGAVSIELPLRDAGHRLPDWPDLEAFAAACRGREVPLHIDGARLWESAPYWSREPAEVAALADTVYVSFYKSLGALAGAAVAGPTDVVDEARRWQRRHGGTLVTLLPYAVSAREGLRQHAPRMQEYHDAAIEMAAALTTLGLRIDPDPPHTNAFRVYAPAVADDLNERLLAHAEAEREHLTPWFRPVNGRGELTGPEVEGDAEPLGVTVLALVLSAGCSGEPDGWNAPARSPACASTSCSMGSGSSTRLGSRLTMRPVSWSTHLDRS